MKKTIISALILLFCAEEFVAQTKKVKPSPRYKVKKSDPIVIAKKVDWRIYGGPEATHMISGDNSDSRGVGLGFSGGMDANINLNPKSYFILGAIFGSYSMPRWIESPINNEHKSQENIMSIEVPIGFGFNLSKSKPEGTFLNISLINNFTFASSSDIVSRELGVDIIRSLNNDPIGIYNLGAKAEFGYKTELKNRLMCFFSIGGKPLMLNLTGNGNKYISLGMFTNVGLVF